jgi:amino acid adenylation domain-containing protein
MPERLHTLFARQVGWRRHEPAVITPERTLTYDELYRRASQVGALLHGQGVLPNQLIAVAMDKGWEQIVAVLGILHSGGAYLPLDPHLPQERFQHLLQDADVRIALTQAAVAQRLNWPPTVRVIPIDELSPNPENTEPSWVPLQQPSDLAYVIYTSGSTGMPKGVMIDHQGAVNTILDMNRRFTVGAGDRVLALSALNFDLSVYDIFGLLAAGGAVVLPDPARLRDPAHWLDLMERYRVTLWNSVPAFMQMAMEYVRGTGGSLPSSVRLVLMSGDCIPVDLPDRIRSQSTQVQIVSLGGATEASVWSILYLIERVDPGWPSIPYGKAMANQHCYVFNNFLEECPDWVSGQIGIGGLGVARGYWHDPEKTDKSFLIHPLTGERIYRTGDLGRYLPDGNIEFLGREDFQVKVGGYRIELGEVEAALLRHSQVREAAVAALTGTAGQQRLIAYIVPQTRTGVTSEALRRFLQQHLPSYMIPVNYMFLDALPLTVNGKVDRKALPEPEIAVSERVDLTPASGLQLPLLRMICEILGIEAAISIHDNLFDLGANSMHLIQLQTRVRTELGQEIPTLALFEHTTVAALAAYLNRSRTEEPVIAQSQQRVEQRHSYRERQRAVRAAIRASGHVSPASGHALSPSGPASSATSPSRRPNPAEREIDHEHV